MKNCGRSLWSGDVPWVIYMGSIDQLQKRKEPKRMWRRGSRSTSNFCDPYLGQIQHAPGKKGNLRDLTLGETPEVWRSWLSPERWERWEQCSIHLLGMSPKASFRWDQSWPPHCSSCVPTKATKVFPGWREIFPFLPPLRKSHISHKAATG